MRWVERLLDRSTRVQAHKALSGEWPTCAVGEVHQDFPEAVRYRKNLLTGASTIPYDSELLQLGHKFHEYVSRGWRNKALQTYDKIQRRTRQLIERQKRAA